MRAGGVLIDALRAAVPPGQFVAREEESFIMARVTRAGLTNAVLDEAELPDRDARSLVDAVIDMVAERLTAGETVMITAEPNARRISTLPCFAASERMRGASAGETFSASTRTASCRGAMSVIVGNVCCSP